MNANNVIFPVKIAKILKKTVLLVLKDTCIKMNVSQNVRLVFTNQQIWRWTMFVYFVRTIVFSVWIKKYAFRANKDSNSTLLTRIVLLTAQNLLTRLLLTK